MHKDIFVFGIDPGLSGAFAFTVNGKLENIIDMPKIKSCVNGKTRSVVDSKQITEIFKKFVNSAVFVYIEKAHAMPGQGVVSMFTNGETFGKLVQASFDFGVTPTIIRATDWKKEFNLQSGKNVEKKEKKIKTFELAVNLFNDDSLFCKKYKRSGEENVKILDGRSDAAIIAYYGYVHNK